MRYALDTEFIDTPECSALISMALISENGDEWYWKFDFPKEYLTPWLRENVVPYLGKCDVSRYEDAAKQILSITKGTSPKIWCYYGAYDWYWFCRLFGGMMNLPEQFENWFHEFREFKQLPKTSGPEHFALYDARVLMQQMTDYWNFQRGVQERQCPPNVHVWVPIHGGKLYCQECHAEKDNPAFKVPPAREGICPDCGVPFAVCKHAYEATA